ncbi:MAG: hypothetical protein R3182_03945, partial [Draconibacterium sp.]|nr:hypothetical protein [Draconibacterium sp.]
MKLFLILFLLFSLIVSKAFSQSFEAGLLFNANGIHFIGENEIFWQSSNGKVWGGGGLSAGIFVKRNFTENLYYGLELRYIQKGSVFEYGNEYGTRSVETTRINYAEIPVIFG